jgi:uncharacterized protein YdhG (YjbR/CyaY superfamily)
LRRIVNVTPKHLLIGTFKDEIKDLEIGKGSIRFQANIPLPSEIVRKLVKARNAENLALSKKK